MKKDVRRVGLLAFLTIGIALWMVVCLPLPKYVSKNGEQQRILALENAVTQDEALRILEDQRLRIRRNLVADFILIVAYTSLFVAASFLVSEKMFSPVFWFCALVAFIAALSDAAENTILLSFVNNNFSNLPCLKIVFKLKWAFIFTLHLLFAWLFWRKKTSVQGFASLFLATFGFGLYVVFFNSAALIVGIVFIALSLLCVGIIFSFFSEKISTLEDSPSTVRENDFLKVFQKELEYLNIRRKKVAEAGEVFVRKRTAPGDEPSTDLGLIGVSLSGGGIRSATFSLGVVQALARNGFFHVVDYLSTVSGGGYLGCCISSLLASNRVSTRWEDFPFHHIRGRKEKEPIQHLRNTSNYLTPRGLIDRLRIPGVLLRGIFINSLVILPYLIFAAWITVQFHYERLNAGWEGFHWKEFYCFTPLLLLMFLSWCIVMPIMRGWMKGKIESRNFYERSFGVLLLATAIVGLLESILPAYLRLHSLSIHLSSEKMMAVLTAVASGASLLFTGNAPSKWNRYISTAGVIVLGLVGPLLLIAGYLFLMKQFVEPPFAPKWILWIAVGVFAYTRRFLDVNSASMHSFYRDRLSEAYLFNVNRDKVCGNDAIKLHELNDGYAAPYHLINASLNLQGSKDVGLRGRMSDFFLFSKYHCGSGRTGYVETELIEQTDPRLDVGTAMAISGAAVAANMGTMTIRSLVLLMALFNVRLGYWLPNPFKLKEEMFRKMKQIFKTRVGPFYFIREILGLLNDKSWYVNVSDGGHIENLGIYQLLLRRCKFIVVADAEADPGVAFGSLARLIRYARIDEAIDIDIDLHDVRIHDDGFSRKHCAMGKIYYGDGQTGYLLYIKASMVGDENEYIQEYRKRFPRFPHQSTADQFFDEAQFEAYRALGFHIADELFSQRFADQEIEDQLNPNKLVGLEDWFDQLYTSLKPRFQMEDRFVELQAELNALECECLDPDLKSYVRQIFPEIAVSDRLDPIQEDSGENEEGDKRFYKIFNLARKQLGFMQNVYVKMQLDQLSYRDHYFNRGWMNLFRRWSQSPHFRRVWAVTIGTFSYGFQRFCEEALKMKSAIYWNSESPDLTKREQYYLKLKAKDNKTEVWQAIMLVNLTAGEKGFATDPVQKDQCVDQQEFAVGFAVVEAQGDKVHLVYYRLRDYYRKMRLTEQMIPSLRDCLLKKYPTSKIVVILPTEEYRLYAEFFKRHRFIVEAEPPRSNNPTATQP